MLKQSFYRSILLGPLFVLGSLSLPVSAQGQEADSAALSALTKSVTEQVVVPSYKTLSEESSALSEMTAGACRDNDLNAEEYSDVFQSFRETMQAWQTVQHFRFGPISEDNRHHRMQFWPDKKNLTARHLSKLIRETAEHPVTSAELAQKSIAVQGLSAYERMLTDERENFCQLAPVIAENIEVIAFQTLSEWQNPKGFSRIFTAPTEQDLAYRSSRETARELHSSLVALLQFVDDIKLKSVMGKTQKKARLKRAESWRSEQSLLNMKSNLEAALALYEAGSPSMQSFLRDEETAESIDRIAVTALKNSIALLEELGPSYQAALETEENYQKLQLVRENLLNARDAVETDLLNIMGLGIGFNALDGD